MAKLEIVNTAEPSRRFFAKNVTYDNLPENCKVYCLVYGASDADQAIKNDLMNLGNEYGDNFFVGFWSMADSGYNDVAAYFSLKRLPAIVITANSSLSSFEGGDESIFTRLDNKHLLKDTESVKDVVRVLYNLFIRGEVADAMTDWRHDVIPKVIELLDEYEYRPTVRGMFYRLVSDEIISNTFKEYKGLIQALSTARKKELGEDGYINPFAFADDSRYIEDIEDEFMSQKDYVEKN